MKNTVLKFRENHYFFNSKNLGIYKINEDDFNDYLNDPSVFFKHNKVIAKDTIPKYEFQDFTNKSYNKIRLKTNRTMNFTVCMTENCNFNCKYCFYGDMYKKTRSHSMQAVILDNVYRTIDFIDSIDTYDTINIGFYGGEPLLEFNKVKSIISYTKTKKKNYFFRMTTNGYLLTSEYIEYLVKHNVKLTISLDINQEIHDKNRKTKTGIDTYEAVLERINIIRDKYRNFYDEKVDFNAVAANLYDYYIGLRVTEENKKMKVNYIAETDCHLSCEYSFDVNNIINYENSIFDSQVDKIISAIKEKYKVKLNREERILKNKLKNIHLRKLKYHWGGICFPPGINNLFLSTDGTYYMCEKLDYSHNIGSVENGIEIDKINLILKNFYDFKKKYCNECWLKNLCTLCYIPFVDDNHLFKSNKNACEFHKIEKSKELAAYSFLCEIYNKNELDDFFV
jgi:uncharacterized protein